MTLEISVLGVSETCGLRHTVWVPAERLCLVWGLLIISVLRIPNCLILVRVVVSDVISCGRWASGIGMIMAGWFV